ncbi:hypothetical protein AB0C96_36005 [Streptomyces sp. NPDC048506]|uniref:LppU/SCO3897 family protein n=1 Tax=Streptomyces sp. NPDC048506 TaxID=3155028 RepID=UPI003441A982
MFTPTGPPRRPWLRPLIGIGAFVAVAAGYGVLSLIADDGKPPAETARDAVPGDCLENRGTHSDPVLFTIPCSDAKADYKVMFSATRQGKCPAEFDQYTERGGRLGDVTLCLTRVKH